MTIPLLMAYQNDYSTTLSFSTYYAIFDSSKSIQLTQNFKAPSLMNAYTVAQSVSTLLGRPIALVAMVSPANSQGNFVVFSPGSQGGTVSCPSGVSQ
jgi:hypothetical protein